MAGRGPRAIGDELRSLSLQRARGHHRVRRGHLVGRKRAHRPLAGYPPLWSGLKGFERESAFLSALVSNLTPLLGFSQRTGLPWVPTCQRP